MMIDDLFVREIYVKEGCMQERELWVSVDIRPIKREKGIESGKRKNEKNQMGEEHDDAQMTNVELDRQKQI